MNYCIAVDQIACCLWVVWDVYVALQLTGLKIIVDVNKGVLNELLNQTISSTRPSCWIQLSTVDAISIVADHRMFMTLTSELSWQRLRRLAVDFLLKKRKKLLFEPLFRALTTYVLHLLLVEKPMVDFIFVVIELFSLSPTVGTLRAEISQSRRFSKGWVTLSADFRGKGASPTTSVGVRKLE